MSEAPTTQLMGYIMPVTGTVVARNTSDSILHFASGTGSDAESVVFYEADNEHGDDVQFVVESIANSKGFLNTLAKGVLELDEETSDEEAVEALRRQVASYRRLQESSAARQAQRVRNLTTTSGKKVGQTPCLGPDSDGEWGECGAQLVYKSKSDVPPLCRDHKDLSSRFYAVEEEPSNSNKDPESHTTWQRLF